MGLLENSRALAVRMIDKYGAFVTVTRVTPGAYDAATDTRATDTETSVAVRAVAKAVSVARATGLGLSFEDAAMLAVSGQEFTIAADEAPFAPTPGMRITSATGAVFDVIAVETAAPNGVPIVHFAVCRGSAV